MDPIEASDSPIELSGALQSHPSDAILSQTHIEVMMRQMGHAVISLKTVPEDEEGLPSNAITGGSEPTEAFNLNEFIWKWKG